jgi:hypothetical protein
MLSAIDALVSAAVSAGFSATRSMGLETPTPTGGPAVDPNLVTPGFWGFAAIAFLALAVVFLVWDMLRRIRRAKYRSEIDEQLDAEAQADAATRATSTDDEDIQRDR